MTFVTLGASEEIGASCHFLKIGETGLILDSGMDPEEDGPAALPRFDLIRRRSDWHVDHVLVTHAHHDHIGSLPILLKEFPHAQIHMTRATRDLADLLLPASARLQRKRIREGVSDHEPLYDEDEIEAISYLYQTHEFDEAFPVNGLHETAGIEATFYSAGHILGAAGIEISVGTGDSRRRIFYTSDTNLKPQGIVPGGEYPPHDVDTLIMEATLGADPHAETTTRRTEEVKLGEAIGRTVGRGGTVLIPVFALGRAQEVLALLDRFKKRGIIPDEVPIFTAGALRAISSLYDSTRFITPRLNPDFEVYGVEQHRLPRSEGAKRKLIDGAPGIYVVSSGMMFERTISNRLAQMLVTNRKNSILLVGFARDDSPARRLLDAAAAQDPLVQLDKNAPPQELKCEVGRFRLSGHSHRRDLLTLVERMRPRRVVLVHGETEAKEWMADNIQYFYPGTEVRIASLGEEVALA